MDDTFDPKTIADDLSEVRRIYSALFEGLHDTDWERPARRGPEEWNLRETVAHLCALTGAGLESIQHALVGKAYVFEGLEDRFEFQAYNRRGIDDHRALPVDALSAEFLGILDGAIDIARELEPNQAETAAPMPIYNRPVKIVEGLSIIMIHSGLFHSAQVAEPAGVAPLWHGLTPAIRHRVIGRVMCALSLLYRFDLGGDLRAALAFRIGGPGGGQWHVEVSPGSAKADEGAVERPSLAVEMRDTDLFCRMFTGRMKLLPALLSGRLRLRGDLRFFLRMKTLFGVDARR